MRAEVLVVADCPHERSAVERLRLALDEGGHPGTEIEVRVLTEETVRTEPGFAGSPTILLDGVDPFADRGFRSAGLSCRVYPTPAGPSGAPPLDPLRRAVLASDPRP